MKVKVAGSKFHHLALDGSYCTRCDRVWDAPVGRAPPKPLCRRCVQSAKHPTITEA